MEGETQERDRERDFAGRAKRNPDHETPVRFFPSPRTASKNELRGACVPSIASLDTYRHAQAHALSLSPIPHQLLNLKPYSTFPPRSINSDRHVDTLQGRTRVRKPRRRRSQWCFYVHNAAEDHPRWDCKFPRRGPGRRRGGRGPRQCPEEEARKFARRRGRR